jgi:hypothetical protein
MLKKNLLAAVAAIILTITAPQAKAALIISMGLGHFLPASTLIMGAVISAAFDIYGGTAPKVFLTWIALDEKQAGASIDQAAKQISAEFGLSMEDSENVAELIHNRSIAAMKANSEKTEIVVKITEQELKDVVSLGGQQSFGFQQLNERLTK